MEISVSYTILTGPAKEITIMLRLVLLLAEDRWVWVELDSPEKEGRFLSVRLRMNVFISVGKRH